MRVRMRKLNQKGSVIIFITLGFALLGTFIGFALDFGRAYLEKARISRLVDAAAIVAAKVVKGQVGNEPAATRAACDSMAMNGASVVMSDPSTCVATAGAPLTASVEYYLAAVQGGPPITHVRVTGSEPVPTTFLRFLGWMVPGNYSTINVAARAEAAPERPVDLVLVLDRSGSMGETPTGSSQTKLQILKSTINDFLGNNFTGSDRIGMISFSTRGCGNASGGDNTALVTCVADVPLTDATSSNITMLQSRVNGLDLSNLTNTQEALRTARTTIAPVFNDSTRAVTRKAVLLVTDGKPTAFRLDTDAQCKRDPLANVLLPGTAGTSGSFPSGCIMSASAANGSSIGRSNVNLTGATTITSTSTNHLFRDVIACTRSLSRCNASGPNGAMFEGDFLRNCGFGNSSCGSAGAHDVLVFAIGIGSISTTPNASFDKNAKCMLARIANASDILNTGNNTTQTISSVCSPPPTLYGDTDTYQDLQDSWPCGSGPCINSAQETGKVYIVDLNGNVQAQLQQVFGEIAAILKLRLTL
jgi:hypothetical protein